MRWLEHKIPPPLVGLLLALGMVALSPDWHWRDVGALRAALAALLLLAGAALDLLGLLAFRRVRTTVNPLRPARATQLVATGVYRFSRNPMYLGMALLLSGGALLLGTLAGALGPVLFVAYITRFQILPEERVMAAKFGDEFTRFCTQVRRWL